MIGIEEVVEWIIKNPRTYPGSQQISQARTSEAFKPLEPKSQMLVIWKSLCVYLKEKIMSYKGVYVKNLGTFTYEVKTKLPKLGINIGLVNNKPIEDLLVDKKTQHIMRPCFMVDNKLKTILSRYNNIEEVTKPASQSSIFQRGHNMIYCNPVPIAAASFLSPKVVGDALNAITNAIFDLITLNRAICLKTGFCNVYFVDKNVTYSYSPEILNMVKDIKESEKKFVTGITPIKKNWRVSSLCKWRTSKLSNLLERPQTPLIKTVDNKSQMLKIMSLDLASTYRSDNNSCGWFRK